MNTVDRVSALPNKTLGGTAYSQIATIRISPTVTRKTIDQRIENEQPSKSPDDHYPQELVNTAIEYGPEVFTDSMPFLHKIYMSEVNKAYNSVVPFRIKHISLTGQCPLINRKNYFDQDLEEVKAMISFCIPGTNEVGSYSMADACREHSFTRDFYRQRKLENNWNFSALTRCVTIPSGKMFAINCRTDSVSIDKYLYEITETKASNRGPLPVPRRDSSIIYQYNCLYVIGGYAEGQKCTRKGYKYDLKKKTWTQMGNANVGLRKPTLCTVGTRYICKLGGLNQFDYINKLMEVYDCVSDQWAIVRASPKDILDDVQILEDALSVQISEDLLYVFGGRNANKFSADTGFLLMISEIKERKGNPPKVTGEYWKVGVDKRTLLTFFGSFSQANVIVHHNCIYVLRADISKALAI